MSAKTPFNKLLDGDGNLTGIVYGREPSMHNDLLWKSSYILPFFVSCAGGTVLAIVIVTALKKAKVFDNFLGFSKEVRA